MGLFFASVASIRAQRSLQSGARSLSPLEVCSNKYRKVSIVQTSLTACGLGICFGGHEVKEVLPSLDDGLRNLDFSVCIL